MLTICTLDAQTRNCTMNCAKCGFDLKEKKLRERLLEKNGMSACPDGLKRLIIKRKVSEK